MFSAVETAEGGMHDSCKICQKDPADQKRMTFDVGTGSSRVRQHRPKVINVWSSGLVSHLLLAAACLPPAIHRTNSGVSRPATDFVRKVPSRVRVHPTSLRRNRRGYKHTNDDFLPPRGGTGMKRPPVTVKQTHEA